jgi:hypothetical protein
MPYVRGGTSQGSSNRPEVVDVYHSNNVYANNVLIALWQPPGATEQSSKLVYKIPSSNLFTKPNTPPIQGPDYTPAPVPEAEQSTRAQENIESGADESFQDFTSPPVPDADQPKDVEFEAGATASDLVTFLTSCLNEAKTGAWRETGQRGRPSNPNIINIWKSIGLTGSYFQTDQTPWCAGFVCFAMKQSGLKWIREAGAFNVANRLAKMPPYKQIPVDQMQPGDLVCWGSSHVNFCYTRKQDVVTFVGGNQGPQKGNGGPPRDPAGDGDVTQSYPGGVKIANVKSKIKMVVRLSRE